MDPAHLGLEAQEAIQRVVGYLNFSSGADDPGFLCDVNRLFDLVAAGRGRPATAEVQGDAEPAWRVLGRVIGAGLDAVHHTSDAFRQVEQAQAVLRLVFDRVLPAYRRHHRDLLFHQSEASLFEPLFIGRVCEAVLREGPPWPESDRIVGGAIRRLNDFIGHRPVAVLETQQKLQPYEHEWVRPIPLFIAGAGVAVGRYRDLIDRALETLRATDPSLLRQAWFDPDLLEELALDPRALDFDHPVNRRPNYHFGGWDPHRIDNRGRYRRFVLQQVTLDAMLTRLDERRDLPYEEVLYEAAAVLAGTMLMGSGISGSGPDSHDSETTLATLMPTIAGYRDAFYEQLLERLSEPHAGRLRAEAARLRQPFGGARQDLNQKLARRRAEQLQHVQLARLFARMGYTEAAARHARVVPVASARMRCEIDCRIITAHLDVDRGRLQPAAALLPEIEDLLHRAIRCGALVDPWNILGFGGQYSLFAAVENSIHDHRVDELIDLVNDVFDLYARLEKEAAATAERELEAAVSGRLEALARWWDQFASTEVSGVEGVSGRQLWESAAQVATALGAWQQAAAAADDVAFWRKHVQRFRSPKAFTLLVESLLERGDQVASMALLTYWLSRSHEVPLAEGDYFFHVLVERWMEELWQLDQRSDHAAADHPIEPGQRWSLTRKFLDYLEANADQYWQVPELELAGGSTPNGAAVEEEEAEEEAESLFSAAYENVTYRDTTDDGFEGQMLEGGSPATDFELTFEAERICERLAFLNTLARLWKLAAAATTATAAEADRDEVLAGWVRQAVDNRTQLLRLLLAVHRYRIQPPRGTHESLVEYSRRLGIKDMLLERIIFTCVETADAVRFLLATIDRDEPIAQQEDWEAAAGRVLRAVYRGNVSAVRAAWPELMETLRRQPLLYVPTSRGGNPHRVVASRSVQRVLGRMLALLPRLGLLGETYQLIVVMHEMERYHPAGPGAVTEFDRLFEIGCKGIAQCLVTSSEDWHPGRQQRRVRGRDRELVACLEQAVERLLARWILHSRNIRLSVLETVSDENRWQALKAFIQRYGHDLFTQQFMNFGNLRAILHEGVDAYLESLEKQPDADEFRLIAEIDGPLARDEAVRWLELTLEAIVENYSEYIDYNSTTTQSDRGELLYTLLDFLRLEASYDRVAWNLRPVVLAHEVLVRNGRIEAAELWRQAVARRSAQVADEHLARLEAMVRQYGMRLPSVADRLGERFVRPLAIDRLCALVGPAVEERRGGKPGGCFDVLEEEIAHFTAEPSGVGFDVPSWLEALQTEVDRTRSRGAEEDELPDPFPTIPQVRLSREEVERQIDGWQED